jgi:toluene monooxygenase system ferredoxin subunit
LIQECILFKTVCSTDDVWEGELQEFTVEDRDIIIIHTEHAGFRAYEARCPHQDQSLGGAMLDGNVLTCPAHLWQFDVTTGAGVNPANCKLTSVACKVVDNHVLVDPDPTAETMVPNLSGETNA